MQIIIDTDLQTLTSREGPNTKSLALYSNEAFEILSRQWVKVGWNQKYSYTFSWLGRPIIQLPEDIVRMQEVIYRVAPDIILETGVAHGGSLIFYASLCKAMGKGRVIGVDISIRPANRQAIESHCLASYISLIEGDSTSPAVVAKAKALFQPGDKVLVILDSCHTKAHVRKELEAYQDLVATGSYLVATDGIMQDLYDVPTGSPEWREDNPTAAALEFSREHPNFVLEQPAWPFNETHLSKNITYWPGAFLRRIS
jgi:cephalosporin hydroxylase